MITIQAAAAGFIYNEEGQVLLIKEACGRFRYGAPGGVVEECESPQAACVREVLEETGLEVSVDYLIGIRWTSEDREVPWLGYAFRCSVVSGSASIQDPREIAEIGWHDPYSPPDPMTDTASLICIAPRPWRAGGCPDDAGIPHTYPPKAYAQLRLGSHRACA